ncbi:MAG TPA: alginate lyase family protein [Bryobacteraceae bacterium]|nr:alginate lyase family protein [Bryobacteraceae bacterium]
MTASIETYYHTIRYLKPVQLYSRVLPKLPRRFERGAASPMRHAREDCWVAPLRRPNRRTGRFRFRFLNTEYEPRGWNDPFATRLWRYNLHYFEAPEPGLISQWIAENPVGEGTGWEPYPTSLRIVNWIKWLFENGAGYPEIESAAAASLAEQARHLRRNLEYRVLANHLLANAKALVFAGAFFDGREAGEWLRTGLAILRRELPEQVLADGAHFERSPMYHSLMLEDVLDLLNLAQTYPAAIAADTAGMWTETAGRMAAYLEAMCHPDGQIAFFNDAAFAIAPPPAALFDYAARLGVRAQPRALTSGYYRLEAEDTMCIFDAGPIGPDYQPGHAHADTLSFELSHRRRRILVNSGTSTYELGPQRQWERSTAAHNTIAIDGADQSEMWSSFRCGRRARAFDVHMEQAPAWARIAAAHDGYTRLADPVIHRRSLQLAPGMVEIEDRLEGSGFHRAEISFYLHPAIDGNQVNIDLDKKFCRSVQHAEWYPEFGRAVENRRVTGVWAGYCPVTFKTRILLEDRA